MKWYRRAADLGERDAFLNVAINLLDRKYSEDPQKKADGLAMLRRAADAGQSTAQHLLGLRLRTGDGVTKDEAEGLRWIQRAANQGLGRAQSMIGLFYARGRAA
jgi:TPR repeat protein